MRTNAPEIMVVLGCMLIISYNRVPHISLYWSNDESLGNKAIKNAISRDRFLLLHSKLHFNHPAKSKHASKVYYMERLISILKQTLNAARTESLLQSIDESMVLFKER